MNDRAIFVQVVNLAMEGRPDAKSRELLPNHWVFWFTIDDILRMVNWNHRYNYKLLVGNFFEIFTIALHNVNVYCTAHWNQILHRIAIHIEIHVKAHLHALHLSLLLSHVHISSCMGQ